MRIWYFALGSGIGAPLRYLIDKFFRNKITFPVGILLVNVVGSFVLGLTHLNYFVMGFCGAFTTWSTFMLDVDQEKINKLSTWINIALTFLLSVAAIFVGMKVST